MALMMRRLDQMTHVSEQDFKNNMEAVGNIKHENVAKLIAYYYSKDEKLIIYDHHGKGSVSALLGKTGENRAIRHVPWEIRLRIAIGVAWGISHIHAQNGGRMVHGNIKAANIYLNSQRYGIVSDLGLVNMIPIAFLQSSRCYAPEVKSAQDASQASDVYSFGILLLQLLTRKSLEPFSGRKAVDIVKLVKSASRKEWNTKVFDGDLSLNPNIREQIVRLLDIGKSCVAKSPKKRPKMSAIAANMIEDVFMMNREYQVYVETEHKLVFLGDENPTFDLEDLSLASAQVLGSGTSGTSYKAILEEGYVIYVKSLKYVIVTKEKFHQHMEVTGRTRHKNVAELKAYYYSTDEQLLLYNYHHEGSLHTMLHGSRDSDKRRLDWYTRLNISLGAARGIAHIHTQNGQVLVHGNKRASNTQNSQMLVHGNIKASNILLNEQKHGMISDVGLTSLISPTTSFITRKQGYSAPEVTNSTELSQASDVYSFGVVLLELLSGKPSQITYNGEVMSLVRWTQTALSEERIDEVFDPVILMHEDVKESMERMMQKAMYCVARVPERRPFMADVLKMLEEIEAGLPRNLDVI